MIPQQAATAEYGNAPVIGVGFNAFEKADALVISWLKSRKPLFGPIID